MIKNNLKITLRHVRKDKIFSIINIAGLAIGIAACLLLISWIKYELSFDKFHKNRDNLYKVITKNVFSSGKITHFGQTPMLLADYLRKNIPEVEDATIYWRRPWQLKRGEKQFMTRGILTESDFLNMFTFPFTKGNPENLLSEPRSIAISESLSKKIFGDEDPIGKMVSEISYGAGDFTVKGVFKDVPSNSHMEFEFLGPFNLQYGGYGTSFNKWDLSDFETYVLLHTGASQNEFDTKIKDIIKKQLPDTIEELYSLKVKDIHLNQDVWSHKQGSKTNVFIFSTVAFLIFLLACINYINLTIAKAAIRRREVGIMKVAGASRKSLLFKFITESSVFSLFSIIFGIFLAYLFLPLMQKLSGAMVLINLYEGYGLGMVLFIFLLTILVAGLYPALHLSSLKPLTMLKEKISSHKKGFSVRKGLVLFQFSVFILLIVGFMFIFNQLVFIVNQDLGFDKDQVMHIDLTSDVSKNWRTFRTELLKNPDIKAFTFTNTIPGHNESTTKDWDWEGKVGDEKIRLSIVGVYDDFIKTFGMKMKNGRFFSREFPSELRQGFVINEEAARIMGFEDPLGKTMKIGNANRSGKIIGVVQDYHFSSLREKIEPMVLAYGFGLDTLFIRINNQNIQSVISHVEGVFKKIAPQDTLKYSFMDEELSRLYTNEQRLIDTLKYFTILAIFISALGLYGLTLYNSNQRTKEIGIRKVNGARISDIVYLLAKESLRWVVLANIIAWPLAFWAVSQWLQNFAYRINITVWPFLAAATAAFVISLLVILSQTIKTARANPVDSLKYE
jgi:putative ABC transport system permease protein